MVLLTAANLSKNFGVETLFSNLTFSVADHEKVALIGANGTGKSTILKIIIGEEDISRGAENEKPGQIAFARGVTYGYLSQKVISSLDVTLYQEAIDVFADQIDREKVLKASMNALADQPHDETVLMQYDNALNEFERHGGYNYQFQIETVLFKFGFIKADFTRKIATFSGGERTKIAFAKLLLQKPDLLILDEPTNHLDVSTIDWLESYLKTYDGAVLFVSHDRYFINSLATRVIELENNALTSYSGNYESYLAEKKMRYEALMKQYAVQQREIERIKRFIEFFKPKPRFVSRAKDREKKLEHMQVITPPKSSEKALKLAFQGQVNASKKILYFDHVQIGYDALLVEPFSFYAYGGDRIAVMGDNGTGKTTLLKYILHHQLPQAGKIYHLRALNIGYLQQNDFIGEEHVNLMKSLMNEFKDMGEKDARNHLGKFGFTGDDVFKTVDVLSGGEMMRLILSKIVLRNYDLLLLDEPTNNLDLLTREALIRALNDYQGAIIFVSHDRYFVDEIATKILYFKEQKALLVDGNYQDLKEALEKREEVQVEKTVAINEKGKKERISPNRMKLLEQQISNLEKAISANGKAQLLEENYLDFRKMEILEEEGRKLEQAYEELLLEIEDNQV